MTARKIIEAPAPIWQPIETAPKDGTPILAAGANFGDPAKGYHPAVVEWTQDERTPEQIKEECGEDFSGWYCDDNSDDRLECLTHWMPLPAPPEASMSVPELKHRVAEIEQQVRDVTDYLCSRGDTMPMRAEIEGQVRRSTHGLNQRGWRVVRADLATPDAPPNGGPAYPGPSFTQQGHSNGHAMGWTVGRARRGGGCCGNVPHDRRAPL